MLAEHATKVTAQLYARGDLRYPELANQSAEAE